MDDRIAHPSNERFIAPIPWILARSARLRARHGACSSPGVAFNPCPPHDHAMPQPRIVELLGVGSLVVLSACGETRSSDDFDHTAAASDARLVCDDGALELEASPEVDGEYVATIRDEAIVDWFASRAGARIEGHTPSGEVRSVDAALPSDVSITSKTDGARALVLRGLGASDDATRYSTPGAPGSSLAWTGNGMRLSLGNSEATDDGERVSYELGAWDFVACEAFADEPPAVPTTDRYCGDPIFAEGSTESGQPPRIVGFDAWYSTHAKVAQVIEKYGDHELTVEYLDYADEEAFTAAIEDVLRYGHTSICIDARSTELSQWGTPTAVRPIAVVKPEPR